MEKAIAELLKNAPIEENASSRRRQDTSKESKYTLKELKGKARFVAIKAKIFEATICQIFAEMLGSVCHTDHDFIEDGHDQTVRFTLSTS